MIVSTIILDVLELPVAAAPRVHFGWESYRCCVISRPRLNGRAHSEQRTVVTNHRTSRGVDGARSRGGGGASRTTLRGVNIGTCKFCLHCIGDHGRRQRARYVRCPPPPPPKKRVCMQCASSPGRTSSSSEYISVMCYTLPSTPTPEKAPFMYNMTQENTSIVEVLATAAAAAREAAGIGRDRTVTGKGTHTGMGKASIET